MLRKRRFLSRLSRSLAPRKHLLESSLDDRIPGVRNVISESARRMPRHYFKCATTSYLQPNIFNLQKWLHTSNVKRWREKTDWSLTPFSARAHQGNWQPHRNCNFRELLSASVELVELNAAYWGNGNATRARLRNSTSRQRSKPVFSQLLAAWFPSVSCSIARFSD
jgi:hypothetical protein